MTVGTKVRLVQDPAGKTHIVASREYHNASWFYRLEDMPSSLFLESSLEVAL